MPDAFSDRSNDTAVPETAAATGRALVPLTLRASPRALLHPTFRPDACFVAHLIATATHAPQTRNLGRAAPGDVVMTYAGASVRRELPVAANGIALSLVA